MTEAALQNVKRERLDRVVFGPSPTRAPTAK
jgi:hypothetical protein